MLWSAFSDCSKLHVQSRSEDVHWTAILVEGGIGDKLVIRRQVNALPNREIVVGFNNFFPAVTESAVAVENAHAAGLQVLLIGACNTAYHSGQAESVVGTVPRFAFYAQAQ